MVIAPHPLSMEMRQRRARLIAWHEDFLFFHLDCARRALVALDRCEPRFGPEYCAQLRARELALRAAQEQLYTLRRISRKYAPPVLLREMAAAEDLK